MMININPSYPGKMGTYEVHTITQYLGVVTRDTRDGWITIYRQMEVKIFVRSENIYTALATVCCFVKLCWT